jgi:hypothetical protein
MERKMPTPMELEEIVIHVSKYGELERDCMNPFPWVHENGELVPWEEEEEEAGEAVSEEEEGDKSPSQILDMEAERFAEPSQILDYTAERLFPEPPEEVFAELDMAEMEEWAPNSDEEELAAADLHQEIEQRDVEFEEEEDLMDDLYRHNYPSDEEMLGRELWARGFVTGVRSIPFFGPRSPFRHLN